jgi:Protein of unknown function (DUF3592)
MTNRSEPFAWSRSTQQVKLVIAIALLALVGLFVIGRTLTIAYYNHLFSQEAIVTVGRVTNLFETHSSRSSGYYVTYTYTDNLGITYPDKRSVYFPEWKSLAVNGTVPVLYLAGEPSTNRLNLPADQYYYQEEGGLMAFLFGGFLVLMSGGLIAAVYLTKGPMFTPQAVPTGHRVKTNRFHRTYKT